MRSGRYQARYTGPDGHRHTAPTTFDAKDDAIAWLRAERPLVEDPETWEPPKVRLAKAQTRLTLARPGDRPQALSLAAGLGDAPLGTV